MPSVYYCAIFSPDRSRQHLMVQSLSVLAKLVKFVVTNHGEIWRGMGLLCRAEFGFDYGRGGWVLELSLQNLV